MNTAQSPPTVSSVQVQAATESPPSFTFLASLSLLLSSTSAFLLMAMLATGLGLLPDPEAPSEEPPAKDAKL